MARLHRGRSHRIRRAVRGRVTPCASSNQCAHEQTVRTARDTAESNSVDRPGRLRQRSSRQAHQRPFIVIARDAVRVDRAALRTAMDHRPLAVTLDPHTDRFHRRPAASAAITRRIIDVTTPQTERTVIAMSRPVRLLEHVTPAMSAAERRRSTVPASLRV